MKNISKLKDETLTEFANRVASLYTDSTNKSSKKDKGQFFTPISVAKFMANLSNISKKRISILDPGSGTGILAMALIEKLARDSKVNTIDITCYETDLNILPYLETVLAEARQHLSKRISLTYKIIKKDFVLANENALITNLINYDKSNKTTFDIVISNPPYFKINKTDLNLNKVGDIISGQPNIYFLFMSISASLLEKSGEMIFITPRSFCSGLYYSKFRKWLVKKVSFANIHLFDSRKDIFASENVLQENIITRFVKDDVNKILVSKTFNGDFSDTTQLLVTKKDVIYVSNGHIFFRIPSNKEELSIIRTLDELPDNFFKLGIRVSTGKVVAFRNRAFLLKELSNSAVPFLWMHNIKNDRIIWPINKKNKAIAILNNQITKQLLIKSGNYLVLKRFTTKEQKKRFDTACIYKEDFEKYGSFALDNMVNYIHIPNGELSKNQINGISKYLGLSIVDSYFRILNGHTQVNANEVYALPSPSLDQLEKFGKNSNYKLDLPGANLFNTDNKCKTH